MKTTALAAILALSLGTAMAAGNYSGSDKDHSAAQNQSTSAAATDHASGDSLMDKTKRAFHRMGDKMRSMGHRVANSGKKDNDTRAMGAGSAADNTHQDSGRQKRMDDAYADWNSKHKQ